MRMPRPKIENMPWLKTETQADLNSLYDQYEKHNENMVPLHCLKPDGVYTLKIILDSGYSTMYLTRLTKLIGRSLKVPGDVIITTAKLSNFSPFMVELKLLDYENKIIEVAAGNYGKSWRLL